MNVKTLVLINKLGERRTLRKQGLRGGGSKRLTNEVGVYFTSVCDSPNSTRLLWKATPLAMDMHSSVTEPLARAVQRFKAKCGRGRRNRIAGPAKSKKATLVTNEGPRWSHTNVIWERIA